MNPIGFRTIIATILASAFASAQPVAAREQPGLRACYGAVNPGRENPDIRLMQVTTHTKRLPFYQNRTEKTPHCPVEVDSCQLKAFVVPGDLLLVGSGMDDFTCASYIAPYRPATKAPIRETAGFVPLSELRPVKATAPSPSDWVGIWSRAAEGEIRIAPEASGTLKITGQASWGAQDAERVKRGAVNNGHIEGLVRPSGSNMLALGEGYDGTTPLGRDRTECRARLRLFGPYLVVEDNGGCGGNNVSFTGVYIRKGTP